MKQGLNRWQKGGHDRLYVDNEKLIDIDRYKRGRISSAYINGEKISNTKAGKLLGEKTYINAKDGKLYSTSEYMAGLAKKKYGI